MMEKLTQAKELFFNCEFKKAFALFEELAVSGNAEAQCFLGEFYDDFGNGFPVDFKKARKLYEQSWAQGFPRAATELYIIYLDGHGVPRDKKKALEFLDAALAQGEPFAKLNKACLIFETDFDRAYQLICEAEVDEEFVKIYGFSSQIMFDSIKEAKKLEDFAEANAENDEVQEDISQKMEIVHKKLIEKLNEEIKKNYPYKSSGIFLLAKFLEDKDPELADKYFQEVVKIGASFESLAEYAYFLWKNDKKGAAALALKAVEVIRSVRGMVTLGVCYLSGNGIKESEEKGIAWLKEAINFADPEEEREELADAYLYLGVVAEGNDKKDEAIENYKKSAELGKEVANGLVAKCLFLRDDPAAFEWAKKGNDEESIHIRALCYRDGFGTKQDYKKFLECAQKLYENKIDDGAEMLADAALNGYALPKSEKKAIEYYKKADKFGSKIAAGAIAHLLYLKEDPAAFSWAEKGAEFDNERSIHILALCYREGFGTEQNLSEYVECSQRLLDLGNYNGAELLAIAYDNGLGVPEDAETALEYYLKAEELGGNVAAEIAGTHILGLRNDGDWASPNEAFKWAKIAVERDAEDNGANFWFGVCFLEGIGVPANKKKARKHLQISANLGNETAQALLDDDGNDE